MSSRGVTETYNRLCEKCGTEPASQKHHMFPQTKLHRKIYGKMLDEEWNLQRMCVKCHVSHAKLDGDDTWSESQFRREARIRHMILPKGTKSYEQKVRNIANRYKD